MENFIKNTTHCNELAEIAREFRVAVPGEDAENARKAGTATGDMIVLQGMPNAEGLVWLLLCDHWMGEQAESCRESDAELDNGTREIIMGQRMEWGRKWAEEMLPKVASFRIKHIDERRKLGIIRFRHEG